MRGKGVEADPVQARAWLDAAARCCYVDAIERRSFAAIEEIGETGARRGAGGS